jgi:hypothetical protein
MPIFIFALVIIFARALRQHLRKTRVSKPKPLCVDCFFAHIQYGSKAERGISCTFGGGIRPIKLDVLYCTDYQTRNLPLRVRAVGFVSQIASAE